MKSTHRKYFEVANSKLVEALLLCESISNSQSREDLVKELPDSIRHNIQRRSSARADVRNIVKTCQNYYDGLGALLEVLRDFEGGGSIPLGQVEALLVLSDQPVRSLPDLDLQPEGLVQNRNILRGERGFYGWEENNSIVFENFKKQSLEHNYLCYFAVERYYHLDPLVNPCRDARKLAKTLTEHYTFDAQKVIAVENPDRKTIYGHLEQLKKKIKPEDNLVIFFAGHGEWDERAEQGYWQPVDARLDNTANWVSNQDILDNIRGIEAKHILLISDACFSGGLILQRSTRETLPAVSMLYEKQSRKAITSGALELVPDRSSFIKYLLQTLNENDNIYIDTLQLLANVRRQIQELPRSRNIPIPLYGQLYDTGDIGGEFVFFKK